METIDPVIVQLAAQLGVSVETIWAALLRQANVAAAWQGFLCVFVASLWWWADKSLRNHKEELESYDASEVYYIGRPVIAGLAVMLVGAGLYEILNAVFNPEYWALMEIVG